MAEIRRARGRVAISSSLTWCGREASFSCGSVGKQWVDWEEPDKKVHHRDEWVVKTQCGLLSDVQRTPFFFFFLNGIICTCRFLRMSFPPSSSHNNITSNRSPLHHQVSPCIAMWCLCCGWITGLDGKQSLGRMKEQMEKENYKMQVHQQKKKLGTGGREEPPHRARNKRVLKQNGQKWIMCTQLVALLLYVKVANCFLIEFADVLIFVRNREWLCSIVISTHLWKKNKKIEGRNKLD